MDNELSEKDIKDFLESINSDSRWKEYYQHFLQSRSKEEIEEMIMQHFSFKPSVDIDGDTITTYN